MMKGARSVIFKAETLIPAIQEAMKNQCAVFLIWSVYDAGKRYV
ncbi:hypothetical protein [Raoultella ornithinolytica]|nr:hypothetical protein [Raoultella ornithinolytica]